MGGDRVWDEVAEKLAESVVEAVLGGNAERRLAL